jgi:hypothetical protein
MTGTGIGVSLFLIALGAILALAVDYTVSGIDIVAIGAILVVVGLLGLLVSIAMMVGIIGSQSSDGGHHAGHA